MATARIHEKAICPICNWVCRSFKLPAHLITEHPHEIRVSKVRGDHCMYASILDDEGEKQFCVCLTCKKGVYHGAMDHQGSRWIAIHAKEATCKAAHREAVSAFRKLYYTPDAPTNDIISVLWEECRRDTLMRNMVNEISDFCIKADGIFTPSDGFKQTMRHASSYKKEATKTQDQINRMVIEHDKELVELRIALAQYKRDNQALRDTLLVKGEEIDALCLRIAIVEEDLKGATKKCT